MTRCRSINNFRAYSNIPAAYSSGGTEYGSNSVVYSDVVNELKQKESEIKEVHLALYLFNNIHLYNELLTLSQEGVDVTVSSLPLDGYDRRKISDAQRLYNKVLKDQSLELLIFPHMYIWYGAKYAGGNASYSFHVKAGLVTYKDGRNKVFLTSGNLAPGDPTHSETAVFMETPGDSSCAKLFKSFFRQIEKRAKPFREYNNQVRRLSPELQQVFDFSFVGSDKPVNFSAGEAANTFFTAPFITVGHEGSNHYARKKITEIVLSAKKRLFVCAQHCHDISPFDGCSEETMIHSIIKAKEGNSDMNVKVLKQVSSSGLADKRRAAFVEGHLYHSHVSQRVNRLVHDKFVLADDTVVITTGNFTATQFGWGQRKMEFHTDIREPRTVKKAIDKAVGFLGTDKDKISLRVTHPRKGPPRVKVLKDDMFSEVNAYAIIRDHEVAENVAKHFRTLWQHGLSQDVEILL